MRRGGEVLFSLVIVVVVGFVVWQSAGWAARALSLPFAPLLPTGWGSRSGLFPLVVGLPTLALAVTQFAVDVRGARRAAGSVERGQAALDLPADVARQRSIVILGTIVGFAIAIWLFGFLVAIPLVTFLYMKLAGESWTLSLSLTATTLIVFYLMFVWWLNIPVPWGFLLEPLLG